MKRIEISICYDNDEDYKKIMNFIEKLQEEHNTPKVSIAMELGRTRELQSCIY